MVLTNNKQMLIYGFDKDEVNFINEIVDKNQLPPYKIVEKSMITMKVKDILNNLKFEIYHQDAPEEKVVVFNNFSDVELDKSISAIRSSSTIKPILAVVTPTSIEWEFKQLLEHLIEEREWYKNNRK